jgi:hypothetical protein
MKHNLGILVAGGYGIFLGCIGFGITTWQYWAALAFTFTLVYLND